MAYEGVDAEDRLESLSYGEADAEDRLSSLSYGRPRHGTTWLSICLPPMPPYSVEAMFPTFSQLLTESEVQQTHEASLAVLDEVGLDVHNERARAIYRRHGCSIGDDGLRVTIPPKLADEFMASVPPSFTFRAPS